MAETTETKSAAAKPAAKKTAVKKPRKATPIETAVRTLAPAVPLALALAHGALTHQTGPQTAATPAPAAITQSAMPSGPTLAGCGDSMPCPLLAVGKPVEWFFVFKFNSTEFAGCAGKDTCPFGGSPQTYALGQHYAFASKDDPTLEDGGSECLGSATNDPVSASFNEIYNSGGKFHYVIWNDQPYNDPPICGSSGNCGAPWAHSKGVLTWNDAGEGFVMQVTTPSWPMSGSPQKTRLSGNSLGCFKTDDNVELSQHFFALALNTEDVETVLSGLANAGVVTDNSAGSMMVSNGGPADIQKLVSSLGQAAPSKTMKNVQKATLSSGVVFLSKSSGMDVPSWQFVSAELGGPNLRVATFYAKPSVVATTTQPGNPDCWNTSLGTPGAVDNAMTGSWTDPATGKAVSLSFSGTSNNGNHAKIGVTTSGSPMAIFGDENQQGTLSGNCASAQNGRGGTFYALPDPQLAMSLSKMLEGKSF